MKKYETDYFKKKYQILADRLTQKEGFIDLVKETRKKLKIPEDGFSSTPELAVFLIKKLTKAQKQSLDFFAFVDFYETKNKVSVDEKNKKDVIKEYEKTSKEGPALIPMIFFVSKHIDSHHFLFTKSPLFDENKYLSTLFPEVEKLMQKVWGVDLLDDHIIFHYVEKYLFMCRAGIDQYIKSKIACHHCKYLGINHFSPERKHMEGKSEGPYSKNYVFNKETNRMLSFYFDSVFVIIKPYATKEMTLQFIEENWDDLKDHMIEKNSFYKQYDVKPSVIKESDDEKNRLVYELNKLSKKELLEKYKGKTNFNHSGVYKESIVSAILKEDYDIDMTSDAVKKTASRFAKSIKLKREPKDIRDI